MRYSVVLPAYNEAGCIQRSLRHILEHFSSQNEEQFEVIVVDDGSRDSTVDEALRVARQESRVMVLPGGRNRGKGAAVRRGVLHSKGERVLVSDADLSTPLTQLDLLERELEHGASIVIGSRYAQHSAIRPGRQPIWRGTADLVTQWVIRSVVPSLWEFADTQSGFKLFRGEVARTLFEAQVLDGYGYDVEILYLAQRRGYRIAEVPVAWNWNQGSKVGLVDVASTCTDVVRVRMHSAVGKYDA